MLIFQALVYKEIKRLESRHRDMSSPSVVMSSVVFDHLRGRSICSARQLEEVRFVFNEFFVDLNQNFNPSKMKTLDIISCWFVCGSGKKAGTILPNYRAS